MKTLIIKIGLFLFVLALPLANRDIFSVIFPRIFPVRIILIALLGFGLLTVLIEIIKRRDGRWLKEVILKDNFLKLLLLLFLVRIISLVNSLNLIASLSLLSFYLSMIGLYLLMKYLAENDYSFLPKLFKTHLATAGVIGLYGFIQTFLPLFGIILPGVLVGGTFIRVPATFYDANHLPPYLLSALPFILVLAWGTEQKTRRWLLFTLSAIMSIVLFITFSRSGIFGFGVAVLTLLTLFSFYRYWHKVGVILSLLLLLSFMVIISGQTQFSLTKRLFSSFSPQEKSTMAHTALLYGEFELFLKYPVLGVGYGSFSEHFRQSQIGATHAQFDPATQVRLPPHSLWLETLTETGIIGFGLYLAIMISVFESLIRALKKVTRKGDRLKITALLASFLGILAGGIFYSYNLEFLWFFLFFIYFYGLRIQTRNEKILPAETSALEPIPWRTIIPLSLLIIFSGLFCFLSLDQGVIGPGAESTNALLAKNVLRKFQVSEPNFFVLRRLFAGGPDFSRPPLFHYLNALTMLFYDVNNFTPRFFSAFFGFMSVLLTYLIGRRFLGSRLSLINSLTLLSLPLYLEEIRSGRINSTVYFSLLVFGLLIYKTLRNKHFWLPLGLFFGLIFLFNQWLAGLLLIVSIMILIISRLRTGRTAVANPFFPLGIFIALLAAAPWYIFMFSNYSFRFLSSFWLSPSNLIAHDLAFTLLGSVSLGLTLLLKKLGEKIIFRPRFYFGLGALLFFVSLINLVEIPKETTHRDEIFLINTRYQINGDGITPIIFTEEITSDLLYYSDIFLEKETLVSLEPRFRNSSGRFFAIIDGDAFRQIKDELVGAQVGLKVVASSRNLVLVERW